MQWHIRADVCALFCPPAGSEGVIILQMFKYHAYFTMKNALVIKAKARETARKSISAHNSLGLKINISGLLKRDFEQARNKVCIDVSSRLTAIKLVDHLDPNQLCIQTSKLALYRRFYAGDYSEGIEISQSLADGVKNCIERFTGEISIGASVTATSKADFEQGHHKVELGTAAADLLYRDDKGGGASSVGITQSADASLARYRLLSDLDPDPLPDNMTLDDLSYIYIS